MYIARVLYPVKVLGPGNRVGIWFDGCEHHCKGCSNPELWEFTKAYRTDLPTVLGLIEVIKESGDIDGFTLTGGDPFLQPDALEELLPELCTISDDIICYTGYSFDEIGEQYQEIIKRISVLIDGKYIENQNDGSVLRGSNNQKIYILQEDKRQYYEDYLATAKNEIQNFRTRDTIISVGIHEKDYDKALKEQAEKRGLVSTEL